MYRRVNPLSSIYVLLAAFPVAYISSVLVYLVMDARSPATSLLSHGDSKVGVGTDYSPWQDNTSPLLGYSGQAMVWASRARLVADLTTSTTGDNMLPRIQLE